MLTIIERPSPQIIETYPRLINWISSDKSSETNDCPKDHLEALSITRSHNQWYITADKTGRICCHVVIRPTKYDPVSLVSLRKTLLKVSDVFLDNGMRDWMTCPLPQFVLKNEESMKILDQNPLHFKMWM